MSGSSRKGRFRQPQYLDKLRVGMMRQLSSMLESQVRTRSFAANISTLVKRFHAEIYNDFKELLERADDPEQAGRLRETMERCRHLDIAFDSLVNERQRQWMRNSKYMKAVMDEFNSTTKFLSSILIEKDLLEKQSQVLETIILSQEKVSQWHQFVEEILVGLHSIFPFNFFFIAYAEEQGPSLCCYFMGEFSEAAKREVRERLNKDVISRFRRSGDANPEIEEHQIAADSYCDSADQIKMMTVLVPEQDPGLVGLLGMAYATSSDLTPQEQSIIRSLLSVMVMVVGSSKVLSRTLAELEYYSVHDTLTGIYNRRYFNDMLQYEIGRSQRNGQEFSVLLLDLDDFKDINDSYGHPLGDEVLKSIGESICGFMRKGDIATRMGGDEFAVILPETSGEGAKFAAEKIRKHLQQLTFTSPENKSFHITASIGLITYPHDVSSIEDMMSGVDVALYRAKDRGKNEVCAFNGDAHISHDMREKRLIAEDLRYALKEDRIQPYFQPIVSCRDDEVFAYEAVARLIGKDGSVTPASTFIEAVEKYGLGRHLDRIMVRKVIEANKRIIDGGGEAKRLFINLSAQEIQGRGILGYAEEMCNQLDIPPRCIVFELLERDAIGDLSHMGKFLSNLRNKGFSFALDDFGSGYNSFHYLRELHFEFVKIDGAFVSNLSNSKIDRTLVRNLARLCQDLDIEIIGEHVESEEVHTILKEMGVDYAQGFHIGRPNRTLE